MIQRSIKGQGLLLIGKKAGDICIINMTKNKLPRNAYIKQIGHIKKLWKDKECFGLERCVMLFLAIFQLILPAIFIRWLAGLLGWKARKVAIEIYVIFKPIILFIILKMGFGKSKIAFIIVIIFLIDLYSYLLSLVFLRKYFTKPISYGRTMLLLLFNFIENTLGFSILYLYFGTLQIATCNNKIENWLQSTYFSFVTAATIGYGDIIPLNNQGRILVIIQVIITFLYMTIILGFFSFYLNPESKANDKK